MAHYVIIMLALLPIAFLPIAAGCGEGAWKCDNGDCIQASYIGDNEDDCGDGSDERCAYSGYIGDWYCDDESNNADCNWDGGDCCGDDIDTTYCNDCECHEADLASFEKRENSLCSNNGKYGEYDDLDEAKKACSSDWMCGSVYDINCDDDMEDTPGGFTGPYYLCSDSKGLSVGLSKRHGGASRRGSCTYEKMDSDNFKCTSGVKPGLARFNDYIDGNYIPKDWVCDGSADCEGDGEDEQGCGECTCIDGNRATLSRWDTDEYQDDKYCRVGAQSTCSDIFKGNYEGEYYYSFKAARGEWRDPFYYDWSVYYFDDDYEDWDGENPWGETVGGGRQATDGRKIHVASADFFQS